MIDRMLEVRAGKQASAATGRFADALKEIPNRAFAVALAELSEEMRDGITRSNGSPFSVVPRRVSVQVTCDKNLNVHLESTLKDGAEAKAFAASLEKLKQQGVDLVREPPPQIKLSPRMAALLTRALGSVKVGTKDAVVSGSLQVSGEVPRLLLEMMQEDQKR